MYSGSDDDDGNFDQQFNSGSNYQSIMNQDYSIEPNSKYDRSFSFSDSDNSFPDVNSPRQLPGANVRSPMSSPEQPLSRQLEKSPSDYVNTFKQTKKLDASDDLAESLGASSEMASIFSLISKFQPDSYEIPAHWKPFIPDLVPAIGSIDAFIKVPRPDSELDELGLVIVDEPSIAQSNPQVLRMELREKYGVSGSEKEGDGYVGCIENAQKNLKELNSWLDSIEEIHRNRPPPSIIYKSKMPEFEELMEPWPEQFEETLKSVPLPSADLDVSFDEYAKIVCALLDIPVKGNLVESLHHLFSLYSQFEGNAYFKSQEDTEHN
ncbi:hypothetical protein GPJ56_008860 [Histomonas meleagridis]|uniref:uncharacterized protein n=1 Tax=Histomonas meleagridis TaxID=135588 RepID=UPI00355A6DFA|nr:hypothetical protein GPJ56_008860 [Histomonas meleagridis]KAH0805347.1 hypothetical protein GO595_001729 [Histomonas meleagridis]